MIRGNKIRELSRVRKLPQEQLAGSLNITLQAVFKRKQVPHTL